MNNFWIRNRVKLAAAGTGLAIVLGCGGAGNTPYSPIIEPPVGSFAIAASPGSQTIPVGGNTTFSISVDPVEGNTAPEAVDVTFSGVPQGAQATLDNSTVGVPGETILHIETDPGGGESVPTVVPGTYTITITGTHGEETHSTSVQLVITGGQQPDFTISITPKSQTMPPFNARKGARQVGPNEQVFPNVRYTVTVNAVDGFTGDVALTVQTLNGITENGNKVFRAEFLGSDIVTLAIGPNQRELFVEQLTGTARDSVNFTVTGKSGAITRTDSATLIPNQSDSFSIAANPNTATVNPGGSGSYDIDVIGATSQGNVSLSLEGALPVNVTSSLEQNSVAVGDSTQAFMSSTGETEPGTYTQTVVGQRNGESHTATITLIVNPPFSISIAPAEQTITNGFSVGSRVGVQGVILPSVEYRVTVTPASSDFRGRVNISTGGLDSVLEGGLKVFGITTGFTQIDFSGVNNGTPVEFDLDVTRLRPTQQVGDFTVTCTGGVAGGAFSASTSATLHLVTGVP